MPWEQVTDNPVRGPSPGALHWGKRGPEVGPPQLGAVGPPPPFLGKKMTLEESNAILLGTFFLNVHILMFFVDFRNVENEILAVF